MFEVDPTFRNAIKLLHSSSTDSAEKIRIALDEVIKQKYGSSKMLINTLNKKYIAEEPNAPGSGAKSVHRRHSHKSSDSKGSGTGSSSSKGGSSPSHKLSINPPTDNNTVITIDDDMDDDDDDNLKELEDLMCVICHRMDVSGRNRLIECADCHSLYHQECHTPPISDLDVNEPENSWCCAACINKSIIVTTTTPTPSKSSSVTSSSTSATLSSNYHKSKSIDSVSPNRSKSSSSKNSSSSSSSVTKTILTNSSQSLSSSSNSNTCNNNQSSSISNVKSITPNINIISADKRLQIMKKKAAKLQETKRKQK